MAVINAILKSRAVTHVAQLWSFTMPRSLLSNYSDLLLTIYRLAQDTPVLEFQDALLEAVKSRIPFDSSMWGTATMTPHGIDVHNIHLHQSSQAMLTAYEAVKHQDSLAQRVVQQTITTLSFNSDVEYTGPEKVGMRALCEKFGHRNGLVTCELNLFTRFVQWMSLYRKDASQVCTEEETQMFHDLGPHLMQALAINRRIHLDKLVGDTARQSWSVAIADTRGVPHHASNQFWDLVETEWTTKTRACLPSALLNKLLVKNQVTGRNIVVHCKPEHGLMYLKARPREKVDRLSPREHMVAKMLAGGMSQKEVAANTRRSPETIRSQIRIVFEKLEITNVVMLAPHLALRDGY
jgi:DNA-binding CsgD family transcriptional regulator